MRTKRPFAVPLPRLVLGTRNAGKVREISDLFEPWGVAIASLADFPQAIEVDETGETFAENARLKAVIQAMHLGEWVLGEDSGICVDALGGAPGPRSARFAGDDATDADNNALLLDRLRGVPLEQRTAHYTCHIVLADPSGRVHVDCETECHGRIAMRPSGDAGFGYDPLFEVIEYHRTFGELGDTVKAVISHRARAMRQLLACLRFGRRADGQPCAEESIPPTLIA